MPELSMSKGLRKARPLTTGLTHFEKILAYYLNDNGIELSEKEEELKNRWDTAFSLLLEWRSREQAVNALMQKFDISKVTAYSDVQNALNLFGDITKSSREGWRFLLFEYNQKTLQLALKDKNLEMVDKCLSRMERLSDLNKDLTDFNPEKLEALDILIGISKRDKAIIQDKLNKGLVDLNDVEAEDIPFEEVKDGTQTD